MKKFKNACFIGFTLFVVNIASASTSHNEMQVTFTVVPSCKITTSEIDYKNQQMSIELTSDCSHEEDFYISASDIEKFVNHNQDSDNKNSYNQHRLTNYTVTPRENISMIKQKNDNSSNKTLFNTAIDDKMKDVLLTINF